MALPARTTTSKFLSLVLPSRLTRGTLRAMSVFFFHGWFK
jgi:hypothetical protein